MVLTLRKCYRHMRVNLKGTLPDGLPEQEIVEQTALAWSGGHDWKYLWGFGKASLRAPITITGGTWTASTLNLEKTGAFAAYAHLAGDLLQVTTGTGLTAGFYEIGQRVDADNVRLLSSPGPDAADLAGTIELDTAALPADVDDVIDIFPADSSLYRTKLVSLSDVKRLRTYNDEVAISSYYYCAQGTRGPLSTDLLEVWPTPTAAVADALEPFYKRRVMPALSTDTNPDEHKLNIRPRHEIAFLAMLEAVALGRSKPAEGDVLARLERFYSSSLWRMAKEDDPANQWKLGRVRGGASRRNPHIHNSLDSMVQDIS